MALPQHSHNHSPTLSNSQISVIKKLKQKKYRSQFSLFVVEGFKSCMHAIQTANCSYLVLSADCNPAGLKTIPKDLQVYTCPASVFKSLSNLSTPEGILAVCNIPTPKSLESLLQSPKCLVLDSTNNPGNLGTIIRTADWFGVSALVLSPDCVDPYNPKVVQASMGSIFSIDIYQSQQLEDTLSQLQDSGFKLVGLSLGGEPLSKPKASKLAIVMGSESHGLSPQVQSLLDYKFSIPGHHQSQAESLNLSIATGIALHTLL